MNKNIHWILTKPRYILKAKLLNPKWKSRKQRKRTKGIAKQNRILSYLNRYGLKLSNISISNNQEIDKTEKDKIFSIWLQGEQNAPSIVKACFASIRANCEQELIVLDEHNLFNWIDIPDFIVDKWKGGEMRPAHFTDICRVELLYQHGGFWLDATDFVVSPLPQWIIDADFFVFHSGNNEKLVGFYSFIQNCFIRSKKHNPLIKAWRDAILIYWQNENKARDYFIHQMLFKKLIDCNPSAKALYNKMPVRGQEPTHRIWFEYAETSFDSFIFEELTKGVPFQKTEYRSIHSKNPPSGSFADIMLKMYRIL